MISKTNKHPSIWAILPIITAAAVTVLSILTKQSFIRVFPLYISIFIMLLMSKVNRFAYLLGGLNSISYGFIALYYNIPGSAISAFLFSFPLQIASFIRWSKSSWKSTTILKKMTPKVRVINTVGLILVWVCYYALISNLGSASSVIDSMSSLLGMYITVLQLLKFSEYTVLMIPSSLLTISLYISLIIQGVAEQAPFLAYHIFSLICVIRSVFSARKILKEQQNL